MKTDRVTADAWNDHSIGNYSHVCSQALGEVRHCSVDVFFVAALSIRSAGRSSTYQSSYASAGVYGTFPAWHTRCDSPVGTNLKTGELEGHSVFSINPHSVSSA